MTRRSRLHLKLAAMVVAASCAAGGVAVAGSPPHQDRAADLTAFSGPVPHAGAAALPHMVAVNTQKVAVNAKKGVSAWPFTGARRALVKSGAAWYYTWSTNHNGITTPASAKFVPMVWGSGSVTAASLGQAKRASHILLTFNEPDMGAQSNMTVQQALNLWPKLMATGMRLGSPAVAFGGATPGGWLDSFIHGAAARHYRVSFITLHWYGGDFTTSAAVSQLKSYIQAVWARYHKPIWLTEFALARFGATTTFPSPRLQAAFITSATAMLQRLSYVWRYAWFALPANSGDGSAGLFSNGAVATTAGQAFEKVDS
jgi:hypothetical protein